MKLPPPELQAAFADALREIRHCCLQDSLRRAVSGLSIPEIDAELARFVPQDALASLAASGLRGELMFPVPSVIRHDPRLLGYYRLLYGYSRKEFYTSVTGFGPLIGMEDRGAITRAVEPLLVSACETLCEAGAYLLKAINGTSVSSTFLDDLTLITLGAQLRGGHNVRKGSAGIRSVFDAISAIVASETVNLTSTKISLRNAAGRTVLIEFAADPDIIIREEMRSGFYRDLIAIEVKAGADFSNIHNRIGEAEKSHQKAKAAGYVECWTIVNVDRFNVPLAHRESPSTNRFYRISDIVAASGDEYQDFRDRITSLTGVVSSQPLM